MLHLVIKNLDNTAQYKADAVELFGDQEVTQGKIEDIFADVKELIESGVIGGRYNTGDIKKALGIEAPSHDTGTDTRTAEERRAAELARQRDGGQGGQ